jgi:Cu/Ag efflux pump CusA
MCGNRTRPAFPNCSWISFLSDRLDEVLSGYTAPLIVRAAGTDLDALEELQKLGAKTPQTTTAHSMLAGSYHRILVTA